eukprot:5162578-Pleurochrysis_carterae.AAC.2
MPHIRKLRTIRMPSPPGQPSPPDFMWISHVVSRRWLHIHWEVAQRLGQTLISGAPKQKKAVV